ncbi:MAG: YncE family protein [Thaumarchaeota archaeon]|nr:YncE family protein [Nitrososphaerota archaeon]
MKKATPIASLLILLLIVASSISLIGVVRGQSSTSCTPTTCQQVYPGIPYAGVVPVQQGPEPPVFGGYMYVANSMSNTVSVIQGMTNIVNLTVGKDPLEPAYDYLSGQLYVPNSGDNTVSVISGAGVAATVPVGSVPLTPAFDPSNGFMYVPDSGGCTVSFDAAQCGDTVSVIRGTTLNATIQVGTGPEEPAVNTNPGSPFFGYVYVPNSVPDSSLNGTVSVISPATDSVVATLELGFSPPSGAIFDPEDGLVYAGPYVINGTTEIGELPVACNASCVMDSSGRLYATEGTTLDVISGTNYTQANCAPCGDYVTYDPVNGWIYAGWAVSGTVPFAYLGVSTEASGVHDENSFNPDSGNVYASCGGCYYDTGNGSQISQHFGNVVFILGNTCGQPGAGNYYNETYATICKGSGEPVITSQPMTIINGTTGVAQAIGNHTFSVMVDSVVMATGRWNATTPANVTSGGGEGNISFIATGPNGTTGYATIKIPKIYVGVNLLVQLGAGSGAPASSFTVIPTLYVDGEPVKVFQWTSDNDFYYITFRVHFSTHVVTIKWLSVAALNGTSPASTSTSSSSPSSVTTTTQSSSSSSLLQTSTQSAPPSSTSTSTSGSSSSSLPGTYLLVVGATAVALALCWAAVPRRSSGRISRVGGANDP